MKNRPKNKFRNNMLSSMESTRNQQSEVDYKQCCVDFLAEHGPTPRSAALQGMAVRYNDLHTVNAEKHPGHKPPLAIRMRMALQLQQAVMEGLINKGDRPQQLLTLPSDEDTNT